MTPIERKALIESRLAVLKPSFINVIDESHKHVGHEGAKSGASHFALEIMSSEFEGLKPIERHQRIYALLKDLIPSEIHALKINARMP